MKRVELLAPAGKYESFLGAIHAGADAVYLGGVKFGARAAADNFDEETLKRAIYYAHLFDRKVYMTLNTLLKQSELEEIEKFITPFYLAGLDGVIVQDLGLLQYIKERFPLMELHISTQMAVTGPYGVRMLKEAGASRVVPARELSLKEMELLKKEGLEIESFIHGSMCYSYSGQCFFSSLLGGRSGNRGTCAQSCRLPYKVNLADKEDGKGKKEEYPLSLKDMCSIDMIPELISAGIDSFKIEGRMKRPEYVAGVTSVYRKYIDQAYENDLKEIHIEEEDRKILSDLYVRSEIQDGYYKRHNGKEMITLEKPSYSGINEDTAAGIYEKYVKNPKKAEVKGSVWLKTGQPAILQLEFKDHYIYQEEGMVETASKRPVTKSEIEKQLNKTGNTDFVFSELNIDMDEAIFLPMKTLNELRRNAFQQLEEELKQEIYEIRKESLCSGEDSIEEKECPKEKMIFVSVDNVLQLKAALRYSGISRLYVAGEILLEQPALCEILKKASESLEIWIKLPLILREKSFRYVALILEKTKGFAKGMLVSNLETYSYLKFHDYSGEIALNYHMYLWNKKAVSFWKEKASSYLAPMECNVHEWKKLANRDFEYFCYGKIPMMVTANCIRLTKDACRKTGISFEDSITDRYNTDFRVQTNCYHCYNVIYNSVPVSLHQYLDQIEGLPGKGLRLEFTTETEEETVRVLEEYMKYKERKEMDFSFLKDYTTGHFKKGAL